VKGICNPLTGYLIYGDDVERECKILK